MSLLSSVCGLNEYWTVFECGASRSGSKPLDSGTRSQQWHTKVSCGDIPAEQKYVLLFSDSVLSDSLWPHGLLHTRLPCPSLSPSVCSNLWPMNQWCHSTISSSVTPFYSCLQSFPASGSFPMSQLFTLGGQSIGASASALVLPMNSQDWFPLGLTGLISLLSKRLSRVFSSTTVQK